MSRVNILSTALKTGDIAIVDKGKKTFQIYNKNSEVASTKLMSIFDIVTLRDLLNDAYPPEEYKHANASSLQR
ncbi:hypothetical protein [Paenibacillus cineris]|uniref:hypothetical protein n=1 Tax=Paenibacillus cineris TaxID=237530 RepID=UPI001B2389AD|nr:hypothetical protein [Paenibacillus cineris]GIO63539.1 hypothetical protein J43TS9_51130 [Paenibacillus cineris]